MSDVEYGDDFEDLDDKYAPDFEVESDADDYEADFEGDGELEVPQPAGGHTDGCWEGDNHPVPSKSAPLHRALAQPMSAPPLARALYTTSAPPKCLSYEERQRAVLRLRHALARQSQVTLRDEQLPELLRLEAQTPWQMLRQGRGQYAAVRGASTQTGVLGRDVQEEEAQTDAPDIAHQACQAPDSGPAASSSAPARGSAGGQRAAAMPQSQALPAFLQWACGLVLDELPRRPAAAATEAQQQQPLTALSHNTASVLSVGHRRLGWDALLAGRRVQAVAVAPALAGAPAGTGLVCCAYSPVVAAQSEAALHDHSLRSLGCLCVWDARAPAAPLHVLLCEGAPRSCCWGAGPCTDVVVAGMEEGGVCAWDLSEPAGSHPQEQMGGSCWTARRPAYTTEAHVMLKDALVEPVVDVAAAASASTSTGSCQLVCLSDSGRVVVYAMQMLASSQAAAAAASDLGMRPGSLLRLVSSGAGVRLGRAAAQPVYGLEPSTPCPHLSAACLALIPGQGTELLVGAGQGTVLRGAWFGLPGLPRQFAAQEWRPPLAALTTNASTALPAEGGGLAKPGGLPSWASSQVVSLALSPACPDAFLAAHSCGTLALHTTRRSGAALVWRGWCGAQRLAAVRWCPTRPCAFLVLDAKGSLYAFDLAASCTGPVAVQPAGSSSSGTAARACSLQVVPTGSSLQTRQQLGQLASRAAAGRTSGNAVYVLGFDDGHAEWHVLPQSLAQPSAGELEMLQQLLM